MRKKRLNGNMKFTIWSGDKHAIAEKMFIGSDNGLYFPGKHMVR